MKTLLFTLVLLVTLPARGATYFLLSQTNSFAAGITNKAKAYTDAHSGSAPAGTVVNSGTPVATAVPRYKDTTGTNVEPTSVTITGLTNLSVPNVLSADQGYFTNAIMQAGPLDMVRIGTVAADSVTNDSQVAIGYNSARVSTNATYSVSIGRHSGYEAHGQNQVNIGHAAGQFATNDAAGVHIGYLAGQHGTNGFSAVVIGDSAGTSSPNHQHSVIIGSSAGNAVNTCSEAIFIGDSAGTVSTNTTFTIAIGYNAGGNASSSESIFIGQQAGRYITSNKRLVIDSNPAYSTNSGALIYGEFDNRVLQINGILRLAGALSRSIAVGPAFTLTDTNDVYLCNVDAQTVTLETAVGHRGRVHVVKTITPAVTATLATTSSQTIDGSTTYSLTASNKFVHVQSDGTNWWIIGSN